MQFPIPTKYANNIISYKDMYELVHTTIKLSINDIIYEILLNANNEVIYGRSYSKVTLSWRRNTKFDTCFININNNNVYVYDPRKHKNEYVKLNNVIIKTKQNE